MNVHVEKIISLAILLCLTTIPKFGLPSPEKPAIHGYMCCMDLCRYVSDPHSTNMCNGCSHVLWSHIAQQDTMHVGTPNRQIQAEVHAVLCVSRGPVPCSPSLKCWVDTHTHTHTLPDSVHVASVCMLRCQWPLERDVTGTNEVPIVQSVL